MYPCLSVTLQSHSKGRSRHLRYIDGGEDPVPTDRVVSHVATCLYVIFLYLCVVGHPFCGLHPRGKGTTGKETPNSFRLLYSPTLLRPWFTFSLSSWTSHFVCVLTLVLSHLCFTHLTFTFKYLASILLMTHPHTQHLGRCSLSGKNLSAGFWPD